MSKPKSPSASRAAVSNVLLVEVPPQFIALCEASGTRPQAALRGMAAMVCGLRYDDDNRLVPLERSLPRQVDSAKGEFSRSRDAR